MTIFAPWRAVAAACALFAASGLIGDSRAQDYPTRPVTIIAPTPPGGGVDFTARLVAAKLQGILGRPFVVENKGGGSGNIGTLAAARSAPDGYTLFIGMSGIHVTNPALFASLPWDPVRDFAGIGMIMRAPHVIVVNKNFPPKTLGELIAYAKANPGKLNYASPGVGTQNQIAAELLGQLTGIEVQAVQYRGTGPALNDVLAGTVNLFINTTQQLIGPLQGDRIRGLAITSPTRHPLLPEIPTTAEAGVPGLEIDTWYALYAPTGTPKPIIELLAEAMKKIYADEDFKERVAKSGATLVQMGPDELDRFTAAQVAHWNGIIKRLGITVQ
jgi:tripartite-type tricarboxylate transporter receptor subunit TctC